MYRFVFTYCNTNMGSFIDDEVDLEFDCYESHDVTFTYKNLDYDMLMDLIKKDIKCLHHVRNGEISICLDSEESEE